MLLEGMGLLETEAMRVGSGALITGLGRGGFPFLPFHFLLCESTTFFPYREYSIQSAILETETVYSLDKNSAGTLILSFPASRIINKFLFSINYLVLGILL
jgi:hypothetical protein